MAEKFQAMVDLGVANSRMKDFYDVWFLAERFAFEGTRLAEAIRRTFERRRTALPGAAPPLALTDAFAGNEAKQRQWAAFVRKGRLQAEGLTLRVAVGRIRPFLMKPANALVRSKAQDAAPGEDAAPGAPFDYTWPPGGPWRPAP